MDTYAIGLLIAKAPLLFLLLAGVIISLIYRRKYPLNCWLVQIALCLVLTVQLAEVYLQAQVAIARQEYGWSAQQTGTYLFILNMAGQLLFNASLALLLVAAFGNHFQHSLVASEPQSPQQLTTFSSVRYAGFWKRFAAAILDSSIISGIVTLLVCIFAAALGFDVISNPLLLTMLAITAIILAIIVSLIYFATMESSSLERTLGKMAVGIKVVDIAYERIGFWKASGRNLGKFISGFVFCIGFIMAGFTKKKQALHDIMAGCLVICDVKGS